MAKKETGFEDISRNIKDKNFAPVYVLHGEEPYFIDRLEELIVENALREDERDFNQTIFYGADSKVDAVINAARRYPMCAERQLVVVREAQELDNIEYLSHYVKQPMTSTVFVICHKYKKLDGRKSLCAEAKKIGVVFESKKKYDNEMPSFIVSYMKERGLEIDLKGAQMLADYLGADLSKLVKETDKLHVVFENSPSKRITPEIIEKNIGLSKDYNSFELVNAIAMKDVLRANRIADYFDKNPKNNPIQQVLPSLFNYFANLMICVYAKSTSNSGFSVMRALNLQWDIQARDYETGLRNYSGIKIYNIIHEIRLADAKSKGFEYNNSTEVGDIYKELLYKIMH
ncbi:MAG: DNA polymerase III subunit delta [Tannerella sp.]|jgi:DNA polymerase-3 subunit delta|nr:DNA polymerase III subunit delta [Tannerella sp.]